MEKTPKKSEEEEEKEDTKVLDFLSKNLLPVKPSPHNSTTEIMLTYRHGGKSHVLLNRVQVVCVNDKIETGKVVCVNDKIETGRAFIPCDFYLIC